MKTIALAAAVAGGLLGSAAAAQAFDCPEPQPLNAAPSIKEAPAGIAELQPVLTGADVTAQVPAIVANLRKRYPTAGSAEIVNTLIAAYCPSVAKAADLSDAQKTERVRAFSKAVLAVLY